MDGSYPVSRTEMLVAAVIQGDLSLLESEVTPSNVNCCDSSHHLSLLMWAVTLGRLSTTQFLLSKGAALSAEDPHHFTVLHRAVWCGEAPLVAAVLAAEGGPRLLERPHRLTGRTPLMLACIKGEREMAKLLVEHGADPLRRDLQSVSALDLAAMCGWTEVVQYLTAVTAASPQTLLAGRGLTQRAEEFCEAASTVPQRALLDELNK
ncbi:hypothetical protein AGDE_06576 [Angomonas deanei]|nr:hypothetical protein AGDE_06576 [Angomonas deanei]|eukprot:EPY37358.1 hypothetical protein AGDE_06576 [Angomonas deanei]